MRVNQWADLTESEIASQIHGDYLTVPREKSEKMKGFSLLSDKRRLGTVKYLDHFPGDAPIADTSYETKSQSRAQAYNPETAVPGYKNWYEEGAVTKPLAQASCGGCWAFSTAAGLESMSYINGYYMQLQEFSVQ